MKNEQQQRELMKSHAAGFGGSDAAMVLAIGGRLAAGEPLTIMQRHRIRVIKGLELPAGSPDTEDIMAGHAFEEEVAAQLPEGWTREFMMGSAVGDPFAVFAHADFFNHDLKAVKECKWSRVLSADEIADRYRAQLQWYYHLGAESVSLVYHDKDGKVGAVDIPREDATIRRLAVAVETLARNWNDLDLDITECRVDDLSGSGHQLHSELMAAVRAAEEADERLKAARESFQEFMEAEKLTAVNGVGSKVALTPATTSVTFDTKRFKTAHPELYGQFTKETKRAASLRVTVRKEDSNV